MGNTPSSGSTTPTSSYLRSAKKAASITVDPKAYLKEYAATYRKNYVKQYKALATHTTAGYAIDVTMVQKYADFKATQYASDRNPVKNPGEVAANDAERKNLDKVFAGTFKQNDWWKAYIMTAPTDKVVLAKLSDPTAYKWNLPPHRWSRPFMPNAAFMPDGNTKAAGTASDMFRRGRIWWYASANLAQTDGTSSSANAQNQQAVANAASTQWGFQFIWNPDSYSTAVQVQMEVTPNVSDQWLGAAGVFPGTETISFNIMIDRTNDFACANSVVSRPTAIKKADGIDFISDATALAQFATYYKSESGFISSEASSTINANLKDLLQRGTLADIEFLYRAINGSGPAAGQEYTNPRGVHTADIGYLIPNLVNIDIGPSSYLGWATSLNVTHTGFTPDMIPIRSEVSVSFNVMATYGVQSTQNPGANGTKSTKK